MSIILRLAVLCTLFSHCAFTVFNKITETVVLKKNLLLETVILKKNLLLETVILKKNLLFETVILKKNLLVETVILKKGLLKTVILKKNKRVYVPSRVHVREWTCTYLHMLHAESCRNIHTLVLFLLFQKIARTQNL